ncbi:hypothetical protein CBW46_014045 [Paenibacillus xerothermodurans]|uniref:Uncharacterized protein n=1 Tax=Paenibacillus xerothermodurans TaxID=1977292 RepID=A0A2W1N790_PAEXE|nr:hypothetical protein CBW46_014045 [Paenibacillus xerothermodurans]
MQGDGSEQNKKDSFYDVKGVWVSHRQWMVVILVGCELWEELRGTMHSVWEKGVEHRVGTICLIACYKTEASRSVDYRETRSAWLMFPAAVPEGTPC